MIISYLFFSSTKVSPLSSSIFLSYPFPFFSTEMCLHSWSRIPSLVNLLRVLSYFCLHVPCFLFLNIYAPSSSLSIILYTGGLVLPPKYIEKQIPIRRSRVVCFVAKFWGISSFSTPNLSLTCRLRHFCFLASFGGTISKQPFESPT